MIKKALPLLGIALLAAVIVWVWLKRDGPDVDPAGVEDISADLSLEGIELTQGREGQTLWELQADNGTYRKDSQLIRLREPKITYYREGREEPVLVSGPHGRVDQARDKAVIFSGVEMELGEDLVVIADNATYTGDNRRLVLLGRVRATKKTSELNASRMIYYLDQEVLKAFGGVRARIE
ncbi:MAG: LPS export ABC transporter periplasmic protein LptC [Desulfonatronovibrionaceae bacterium]